MRALVLSVVVALLAFGAWRSYQRAAAFERRAQTAESFLKARRAEVEALEDSARRLEAEAAKRDTVIQYRVRRIAVLDSIAPPPDTCAPYLRERDLLIAAQADQLETKDAELELRGRALLALRAATDTLEAALASRSRPLPRISFGPEVGVGGFVGLCADGRPCAGVGITLSLGRVRL